MSGRREATQSSVTPIAPMRARPLGCQEPRNNNIALSFGACRQRFPQPHHFSVRSATGAHRAVGGRGGRSCARQRRRDMPGRSPACCWRSLAPLTWPSWDSCPIGGRRMRQKCRLPLFDALESTRLGSSSVPGRWPCEFSGAGRFQPKSGIGPNPDQKLADTGSTPVEFGRTAAKCVKTWGTCGQHRRSWFGIRHSWAGIDRCLFEFGQCRPSSARIRPSLTQSRPKSTKLDQDWEDIDQHQPSLAGIRPRSAPQSVELRPALGRIWPEFGRKRPAPAQVQAELGQIRPTLARR